MNILAIGAHPDDIEIGCGGALARHVEKGDTVTMLIITKGGAGGASPEVREREAYAGAKELGVNANSCIVLSHIDTKVPTDDSLIKDIEDVVATAQPERAYIPYHQEIHQDHRTVSFAALSALRNTAQVLMYEGPSSFPNFTVDYWIDITNTLEKKQNSIRAHESQGHKEILKLEAITGMNRYRGFQCRRQYAEGFRVFRLFE
jgi:LmbE family N-acetylglucosaminyl deacetylase